MKIINFSDLHGEWDNLKSMLACSADADFIICNGDITHFGREEDFITFIQIMNDFPGLWFSVTGNCDLDEINDGLTENKKLLSSTPTVFETTRLFGISGSLPCPVNTPGEYTDQQLREWLKEMEEHLSNDHSDILISHQPPADTAADRLPNGVHVGSQQIRGFIQKFNPSLCLTGHIHEGRGLDRIGSTTVVNPGALSEGYYAEISSKSNGWVVELKSLEE